MVLAVYSRIIFLHYLEALGNQDFQMVQANQMPPRDQKVQGNLEVQSCQGFQTLLVVQGILVVLAR